MLEWFPSEQERKEVTIIPGRLVLLVRKKEEYGISFLANGKGKGGKKNILVEGEERESGVKGKERRSHLA